MTRTVVFRPQAEDEAVEVRRWYEARRTGLGDEFGAEVEAAVDRIAEHPLAYPRVRGDTRRAVLKAATESNPEKRRARYFKGVGEMYAELEEVFLTMEGAGQWAAYRFAKAQAGPSLSEAAIVGFVRDNRKYWSQEEGLALFLLVDAMVPGWQGRVFGPEVASPLTLLEDAVRSNWENIKAGRPLESIGPLREGQS